jgi:hypothetical protein
MQRFLSEDSSNYENLSFRLLNLDESVLSVTIASTIGKVLSMRYRPSVESLKPSQDLLDKSGSLIAVISGLVKHGEVFYGDCKYVMFSYDKIQVALVPIKSKNVVIALGIHPNVVSNELAVRAAEVALQ